MYRLLFCVVVLNCLLSINSKLVNKKVERVIDLSSELVKITTTITIENTGKTAESHFLIYLEPAFFSKLSYISIEDTGKIELDLTRFGLSKNEKIPPHVYNVKLPQSLATGRTITIELEEVFSNLLNPIPSSVNQKEKQLVRYFGSLYFYSAYTTTEQTTAVIVNSGNIKCYSKLKPISRTNFTINYGPFRDVLPSTLDPMIVHFERGTPSGGSHWGNIPVEEQLKGLFSLYNSKNVRTSTQIVYYNDINENISTSQIHLSKDWVEIKFGGWNSSYTLGYNVPSYKYLYNNFNNYYLLRMRLINNVYDDVHLEELKSCTALTIVITDMQVRTPRGVERLEDSFFYNILEFQTQYTVKFHRSNLVDNYMPDFKTNYFKSLLRLLHQSVLLYILIALMFAAAIVYGKLHSSILKNEKNLQ